MRDLPFLAALLLLIGSVGTSAGMVWLRAERTERELAAARMTGGGDAARGAALTAEHGCGGCHRIPGIPGADALTGPPLDGFAQRVYIAGVLLNTPDNLMRWLQNPPAVDPLTAMPAVGLGQEEARDVAAYLYSRR